jgi:hypothetical protein
MSLRYCRRCQRETRHREVRVNVHGEENEGIVSRAIWGVLSFGANEFFADNYQECNECGRRTS